MENDNLVIIIMFFLTESDVRKQYFKSLTSQESHDMMDTMSQLNTTPV